MVTTSGTTVTDVDFQKDMSHLNGTYMISGLGSGATDLYGQGYDVMTSAIVDKFGTGTYSEDLRVYYEGDHDDFIDTDDIMNGTEGVLTMSSVFLQEVILGRILLKASITQVRH